MQTAKGPAVCGLLVVLLAATLYAETTEKIAPRDALALIARFGAKRPFLKDSPDIYLEPGSLNKFFTMPIYRKLEGNGYFGYRYDEGFTFNEDEVQIAVLKDITEGMRCSAAYHLAIEKALAAAGLVINPKASCQIGICIVGIEERETEQTLPGIMVEAYLRNSMLKKSFFIRYGAGSSRGLGPAIRLSAEMLVAELNAKRILQKNNSPAKLPLTSSGSKQP